jgi:hypothetical protein
MQYSSSLQLLYTVEKNVIRPTRATFRSAWASDGCADHLRPNPLITHWPSPSMTRGPPPRQLYVTRHHVLLRPGHARRLSNSRSPTTPVHGSDHSWGDTPPERARRIALPVEKAGTAPADRHSLGEEEEREREQWARRWRGRKG